MDPVVSSPAGRQDRPAGREDVSTRPSSVRRDDHLALGFQQNDDNNH